MTETTRTGEQTEPKSLRPTKHVHHGRTPAAWAGTMITLVAFLVGGIGLVLGNWTIFWVGAVLVVVAVVATVVLRKMGFGAD
jgi:hypothetical protein